MGVGPWIEQQLQPDTIPENPVLLAKLEPLDTLLMGTAAMLEKYPSPQMIKSMIEGRLPMPQDPQTRAAVQTSIARYLKKQAAAAAAQSDAVRPPEARSRASHRRQRSIVAGEPAIVRGHTDHGRRCTNAARRVAAKSANRAPSPAATPGDRLPPGARITVDMVNALPLDADQKQAILNGTQESRLALLESLPDEKLVEVLEALPPQIRTRLANAGPPALRRRVEILNTPQQVVNRDLSEGKLLRAIYSNRQLDEVLTDFWFNHFNVYLDKGADRYMITAYERDVIRPHVLGNFKDLLLATAREPGHAVLSG